MKFLEFELRPNNLNLDFEKTKKKKIDIFHFLYYILRQFFY